MRLSAEQLRQPISDDLPCGEDLEYDPVFQEMEVMMQTTAEQQFGDTIIPGTLPDWKGVAEQVDDLNKRTRDLRVLTYGALADLSLKGLKAFSDSLDSLNTCLEVFWDSIYPNLEADDDDDATIRLNCLQILNDYEMVSFGLERAPLIEVRGLGSFSLHDIELAEGKRSPGGGEKAQDIGLIQGAFGNADVEVLKALGEGVRGSIAQLKRTNEIWSKLAKNAPSINFDVILKVLDEIRQAINKYAPAAATAAVEVDKTEGMNDAQEHGSPVSVSGATMSGATMSGGMISGAINSRADVVNMIDKICEYYSSHEPSSPIPLLLRRAQRLVPKSFVEILEDIAPDGIAQLQVVSGKQ
jgi:type VI secretion system protein ImpA